jgi:hypothetical protein
MPTKIIEQQVQKADLFDLELKSKYGTFNPKKNSRNRQSVNQTNMTQELNHLESVRASWAKFSLVEQMANIGSEVSRALRAKGNQARYWGAVARALDLFYLTVEDLRWKGRLREVLRVRELFAAAALGSDEFKTSLEDLDRYFDCFAWLARSNTA